MKFVTGYLWRGEEHDGISSITDNEQDSILLQQLRCGRNEVVLACVSDGGLLGGYLTSRLKEWLQKHRGEFFAKNLKQKEICRSLQEEMNRISIDLTQTKERIKNGNMDFSAILIVGREFWLMQGGACGSYYLNRRFLNTHCRQLGNDFCETWQVIPGKLEREVGMLLGTHGFLDSLSMDVIRQCMAAQDISREEQIANRLKELYRESRRGGYMNSCAAVYIKSVS